MSAEVVLLAIALVQFTGPDDQVIHLNPADVVTIRVPRSDEHFAAGIKCLIHTVDGKFVGVIEPCSVVLERLHQPE